jgi:hypothetical protein
LDSEEDGRRDRFTAPSAMSDQIVKNQHFSLLELLDRLLDKGVMVKGEILLSVADIDLVYLNLGLLLSSVKTVEQAARRGGRGEAELISWQTTAQEEFLDEPLPEVEGGEGAMMHIDKRIGQPLADQSAVARIRGMMKRDDQSAPTAAIPFTQENRQGDSGDGETRARMLPSAIDCGLDHFSEPKTNIDPQNVEKGLTKLVLTLVDLIRKLMEKQAVRRIEAGQLHAREIERMGDTFLLLDEKMEQLKKTFGLQDEDLNLDLGPLGELI